MGRPKKVVDEIVEEKVVDEIVEEKSITLLKEITVIENELKDKRKEYSDYIASQRKEVITPSLNQCLKMSMRDDLNSDRRELKKVTAMAMSKLRTSK